MKRQRALLFTIQLFVLIGIITIFHAYLTQGPIVQVDADLNQALSALRTPQTLSFFSGFTHLAEASLVLIAAAVLSAFLWHKQQRLLVTGLWIALVTSETATYLLKKITHRERPPFPAIAEDSFSLPSNHATLAVAFYGFLAYLALRRLRPFPARAAVLSALILLVILLDFSRLYLGVHYLSDVLAGNLIGLTGILCGVMVIEWVEEKIL